MRHIKRDGGYLCGNHNAPKHESKHYQVRHEKFSDCHSFPKLDKVITCTKCVKRYFEICDNLNLILQDK